jgi:hypothetical protein
VLSTASGFHNNAFFCCNIIYKVLRLQVDANDIVRSVSRYQMGQKGGQLTAAMLTALTARDCFMGTRRLLADFGLFLGLTAGWTGSALVKA